MQNSTFCIFLYSIPNGDSPDAQAKKELLAVWTTVQPRRPNACEVVMKTRIASSIVILLLSHVKVIVHASKIAKMVAQGVQMPFVHVLTQSPILTTFNVKKISTSCIMFALWDVLMLTSYV